MFQCRKADVEIMPLPNTRWARDKYSLTMLQYMASGGAVCVSPGGLNADIAAQADVSMTHSSADKWYDALDFLYRLPQERAAFGRAGRELVCERFDAKMISRILVRVFHDVT